MRLLQKLQVLTAKMVASTAHRGQLYGNGEPYYKYHVRGVAKEFEGRHDYYVTALLHDVVEDSRFTHNDIVANFGPLIGGAVLLLTHLKGDETYNEYIDMIAKMKNSPSGEIAIAVKIADARFNLSHCQAGSGRAAKYIGVLIELGGIGDETWA